MKTILKCLLPAAFCFALSADISAVEKPNVIVIFTDDHGYSDLSCQGVYDDVKTPHIDALATGGVRMTDGYATRIYKRLFDPDFGSIVDLV
jgi:hypothetical protein